MPDRRRLRCRLGFHVVRSWELPDDLGHRLIQDRWSWSSVKCIHCDHASVRMVRVERVDGNTGSVRG